MLGIMAKEIMATGDLLIIRLIKDIMRLHSSIHIHDLPPPHIRHIFSPKHSNSYCSNEQLEAGKILFLKLYGNEESFSLTVWMQMV